MSWMDNTVACSIQVHTWGITRGVKAAEVSQYSEEIAEKVARKQVSMSKRLIDCVEYKAIMSRDGQAGKWFAEHSVPSLFRHGVYAVPVGMMERWTAYVTRYENERFTLVWQFRDAYEVAVEQARAELGELFRAEEYPSGQAVYDRFGIDVRYLELGVPGRLSAISPETFARAQEDFLRAIEEGKSQIEALLCQEAEELCKGLREALQGLDDGTLKRFHESHITKLQEWAALFLEARDVTGFEGLREVAQRLSGLVCQADSESVKRFSFIRADVKRELDGALVALKDLMEVRPVRQMVLE